MAIEEYAGSIVLEVDGTEYECTDFNPEVQTGRKLVKTMNSTGRAKGFSKGIATYEFTISVVIPLGGDIDWGALSDSKVTIYPLDNSGQRTTYQDCFCTGYSEKYTVDNEARRDVKMTALNKVNE